MFRATLTAALAVAAVSVTAPASASPDGLVLSRHGVVRSSTLPHCHFEDGSGGRQPCTWNIGRRDGDGQGLAYWVGTRDRAHYVWATSPVTRQWRWVSSELADALAEGGGPRDDRRKWERCIVNVGPTTYVKCPDGHRVGS